MVGAWIYFYGLMWNFDDMCLGCIPAAFIQIFEGAKLNEHFQNDAEYREFPGDRGDVRAAEHRGERGDPQELAR